MKSIFSSPAQAVQRISQPERPTPIASAAITTSANYLASSKKYFCCLRTTPYIYLMVLPVSLLTSSCRPQYILFFSLTAAAAPLYRLIMLGHLTTENCHFSNFTIPLWSHWHLIALDFFVTFHCTGGTLS